VLPPLPRENHPKDIFNADECWLFFSLLPHKYAFKDGRCHEGTKHKDKITVFVCAHSLSEKMPLLTTAKPDIWRPCHIHTDTTVVHS
jgi:hypothetical protein